jgi:hypothetical protein
MAGGRFNGLLRGGLSQKKEKGKRKKEKVKRSLTPAAFLLPFTFYLLPLSCGESRVNAARKGNRVT